jgi:hypothetical protein
MLGSEAFFEEIPWVNLHDGQGESFARGRNKYLGPIPHIKILLPHLLAI